MAKGLGGMTADEIAAWVADQRARGAVVTDKGLGSIEGAAAPASPGPKKKRRRDRKAAELVAPASAFVWSLTVPVEPVSEMNRAFGHPAKRHGRFARQSRTFRAYLLRCWGLVGTVRQYQAAGARVRVRWVRLGPGTLDDDNLAGAFKALRDTFAYEVGRDDGDPAAWEWVYGQDKSDRFGFRIEVTAAEAPK